jgi:hypothetical protein
MGRWLSALRAREFSESAQKGTDKTDKTSLNGVLSVLSVPVLSISQNFSADDWQAYFDERAGIREFDGEMPRSEAERLAVEDTIAALGPRPRAKRPNLS